jgi:hypothetical protein
MTLLRSSVLSFGPAIYKHFAPTRLMASVITNRFVVHLPDRKNRHHVSQATAFDLMNVNNVALLKVVSSLSPAVESRGVRQKPGEKLKLRFAGHLCMGRHLTAPLRISRQAHPVDPVHPVWLSFADGCPN